MRRPALPAVAVAVLLVCAGCVGTLPGQGTDPATNATTTSPTTDTAATTEPTTTPPTTTTPSTTTTPPETTRDGHYRKYEFRVREIAPRSIAGDVVSDREDLYHEERRLADDLFANGTARHLAVVHAEHADEPGAIGGFEDGEFLRENGTYYRVNATAVDRRESRGYEIHFEGPIGTEYHEDYDRAEREAVNYSSLSPADKRLFEYVVPVERDLDGAVVSGMRFWAFPDDVDRNDSVLVDGEVHFVRYEGDLYRVQFDGERPPVVRSTIRYDLVPVANSSEEFVDGRLDRLVTPLNASSGEKRSVLARAIDEGGFSWEGTHETVPRSFRETEDWLAAHPPDGPVAYVRHEGTIYRISLYKIVE